MRQEAAKPSCASRLSLTALTLMLAVLTISSLAMAACQAKDSATAQHATVSAWGNNFFGQLGNETYNTNSTTPVEVSNLDGADLKALARGQGHSLALKDDGTVWAWGSNTGGQEQTISGQLGNDAYTSTNTPVQVSDLSGVTLIAAGDDQSLAA